jgi:hypothetical protein
MPISAIWNPALHPRAPKGGPAGGQFSAGKGSTKTTVKAAPKKTTTVKKTTVKVATGASAKAAQAKAKSVPFAELKKLTTMANDGKKLTPAQAAIVNAGKTAHADHVAHEAHVTAVKAKAKPKATVKKTTTAKKTTAKK